MQGHPVPSAPWSPSKPQPAHVHLPHVPAGNPGTRVRRGQFSLASQSWAVPHVFKAAYLPSGAASAHDESAGIDQAVDQRMDTQEGWQNCVCSQIRVVGWLGAKARADLGAF